jgi:hypothetical protein
MNAKHNNEIELKAKLALDGGRYEWNKVPIEITEGAKKTDPVEGALRKPGWWRGAGSVARDTGDRFLALLEKVSRARDEKKKEQRIYTGTALDEPEWREYLGNPTDDARAWLAELATKLDMNTAAPWYSILRAYVEKLPLGAKCKDIGDVVLQRCLTELCSEKENANT